MIILMEHFSGEDCVMCKSNDIQQLYNFSNVIDVVQQTVFVAPLSTSML